ncbi:twin-arginine translocase TatA/TatE family subunit [bacterium]|nr:twin-arginine translocase TatA/TatE family subunit [bacterium]
MFGIGFQELIVILIIALIIVGPKKLPEIAKAIGRGLAELRKASNDIKDLVNVDMDEEKHPTPHPYDMLDKVEKKDDGDENKNTPKEVDKPSEEDTSLDRK